MGVAGDIIRKVVSFALLIAAGIAIIGFFIGVGTIVFEPFKDAFNPFDFSKFGAAVFGFMRELSLPLIMFMLGLIGLTLDSHS